MNVMLKSVPAAAAMMVAAPSIASAESPYTPAAIIQRAEQTIGTLRTVATANDPIFAVLSRVCAVEAEYAARCEAAHQRGEDPDGLPATRPARLELARTVPTTVEGLAALTSFVIGMSDLDEAPYFETEDSTEMLDFLRSIAISTSNLSRSSVSG